MLLINEICKPNVICELLVDNFGSFVLQSAMKYSNEFYYFNFIKVINFILIFRL
jgi:hypothetical protein